MNEHQSWKAFTVECEDHIAQVTLIGPGKGNAMGPDCWAELPELFAGLDADPNVRAVVIVGSGTQFTFGLDLSAMKANPDASSGGGLARQRTDFLTKLQRMQAGITAVAECRKPVIAAIHGWCIGGGVDLISAADIRYASADAKFSVREVKVAMVADLGTLARLPAIIGDGHLRELALTGKNIDAARAEKIGLVNDVFESPEATLAAARATAKEIRRTRRWSCRESRTCSIIRGAQACMTAFATLPLGTPRSCRHSICVKQSRRCSRSAHPCSRASSGTFRTLRPPAAETRIGVV